MINQGDTIRLLRQKRPAFQRTSGGGFDIGKRQFKCLTSSYLLWLEKLFRPGANDGAIMHSIAAFSGSTIAGHKRMYVSHADIEQEDSATTCIIGVQYEGVLFPKPGHVRFSTATQEQAPVLEVSGSTVISSTRLDVPVPTVTHTYTALNRRPSAVSAGTAAIPPGISSFETLLAQQFYADFLPTSVLIFEGWVLQSRESIGPGGVTVSPVWQVTDTYQFVQKRAEVS